MCATFRGRILGGQALQFSESVRNLDRRRLFSRSPFAADPHVTHCEWVTSASAPNEEANERERSKIKSTITIKTADTTRTCVRGHSARGLAHSKTLTRKH